MIASGALPRRTIDCTRQLNTTDRKADRQIMLGMSCTKRGSIVGVTGIAGGMSTNASGGLTGTGTIATTIAMTAGKERDDPGAAYHAAPFYPNC